MDYSIHATKDFTKKNSPYWFASICDLSGNIVWMDNSKSYRTTVSVLYAALHYAHRKGWDIYKVDIRRNP